MVKLTRSVFRRGLQLINVDGRMSLDGDEECTDLGKLVSDCGLLPIAIEQEYINATRVSLMLPTLEYYGVQKTHLKQRFWAHSSFGESWEEVSYLLGAVEYHCLQLAEGYVRVRKHFLRGLKIPGTSLHEGTRVSVQGTSDHIWYELDALLSAARRTLDMSRYTLWRAYGKGSVPSNFRKTVESSSGMPAPLAERLRATWDRFGKRLTDYRDCVQHNASLTRDFAGVALERTGHGIWLVRAGLPDNPEEKSKSRFMYKVGLDALDYAYAIACEWIDVMNTVGRHVAPHVDFDGPIA